MRTHSGQRLLFFVPDKLHPTGGINVLLDIVEVGVQAGINACLLTARQGYVYPYTIRSLPERVFDPRCAVTEPFEGAKGHAKRALRFLKGLSQTGGDPAPRHKPAAPLDLRPDDVIVVPDWAFEMITDLYPDNPQVVIAQGPEPLFNGFGKRAASAASAGRVVASIATSQASADALALLPVPEPRVVTLAVRDPSHGTPPVKRRQIAYMPRKRPHMSDAIARAIARLPEAESYSLVPIDRVSSADVDRILAESLLYLSIVRLEGFGLPAAEAMRAECIVVGFDGVGGREFLTAETGVPVPGDDAVALVEAVRRTLRAYAEDPAPFDRMRAHAAKVIGATYTETAFTRSVQSALAHVLARATDWTR